MGRSANRTDVLTGLRIRILSTSRGNEAMITPAKITSAPTTSDRPKISPAA